MRGPSACCRHWGDGSHGMRRAIGILRRAFERFRIRMRSPGCCAMRDLRASPCATCRGGSRRFIRDGGCERASQSSPPPLAGGGWREGAVPALLHPPPPPPPPPRGGGGGGGGGLVSTREV